ncbi:hypothetical protein GYMLUDRAFT_67106 [Collybiopsis luxurians FD-317 M1]|nr:hypothetical protein GYMLUDRAFT_67106 [Collybiopsis luxurians FD-317 M1]
MPSLPISTDNLEEREPRNLKDLLADAASKIDDLETKVKESDMSRLIAEEKARNAETRVKGLESLLKERDAANGDISDLVNQVNELKETLSNVKLKKDILSQRVTALEDLHAASVQKELIEHANIHVLIRLLSHAREDFSRGQLTQEEMLQTCDNLGDQLKEVAARRLEMAPVGFLPIQRAMRMRTRRNWDTAFSNETEYDEKSSKTTLDTENNDLECSSKRPRT